MVAGELFYQSWCVEAQSGGPHGGVGGQDQGGTRDGERIAMFIQWCGDQFMQQFVERHQFPCPGEQLRVSAAASQFVNS